MIQQSFLWNCTHNLVKFPHRSDLIFFHVCSDHKSDVLISTFPIPLHRLPEQNSRLKPFECFIGRINCFSFMQINLGLRASNQSSSGFEYSWCREISKFDKNSEINNKFPNNFWRFVKFFSNLDLQFLPMWILDLRIWSIIVKFLVNFWIPFKSWQILSIFWPILVKKLNL